MREASLRFRAANAATAAKFGLIRAGLVLAGKQASAAKVADGRASWALYAGGRMDFDLRFGVAATCALAARLPAGEAADFHCLWRAGEEGDAWGPYLEAYFRGITARHFPASGGGGGRGGRAGGAAAAVPASTPVPVSAPAPAPLTAALKAALAAVKVAAPVVPAPRPGGDGAASAGGAGGAPSPAAKAAAAAGGGSGGQACSPDPATTTTLAAKAARLLARPLARPLVRPLSAQAGRKAAVCSEE